jgi:hypothetical protein
MKEVDNDEAKASNDAGVAEENDQEEEDPQIAEGEWDE